MKLQFIYVCKDGRTIESFREIKHYEIFVLGFAKGEDEVKIREKLNDKLFILETRTCEEKLKMWLLGLSSILKKLHMDTEVLWEL